MIEASYKIVDYPGPLLPKDYEACVYSAWLRELRKGNDYFRLIKADAYYKSYHPFIKALLSRPNSVIRLAVLSDDQDIVLGFAVMRGTILDFVYVAKESRKQGIASKLVPRSIDTLTHVTHAGLSIWGSKLPHCAFNPFA